MPLEACWLLGSPLVSPRIGALAEELGRFLRGGHLPWDRLLMAGLLPGGRVFRQVATALLQCGPVYMGPTTTRRIAALAGGLDGYLARRTAKFRKNLRRSERLVAGADLRFEWWNRPTSAAECERLFARLLAVEARGWKGSAGVGIDHGDMCCFYRQLMALQGPEGSIRLGFARQGECDQAYILGGVHNGIYRGYQFSFAVEHEALGLGNWMQLRAIEQLCAEGAAYYDLGSDMAYKVAWSDGPLETCTLVVQSDAPATPSPQS